MGRKLGDCFNHAFSEQRLRHCRDGEKQKGSEGCTWDNSVFLAFLYLFIAYMRRNEDLVMDIDDVTI